MITHMEECCIQIKRTIKIGKYWLKIKNEVYAVASPRMGRYLDSGSAFQYYASKTLVA